MSDRDPVGLTLEGRIRIRLSYMVRNRIRTTAYVQQSPCNNLNQDSIIMRWGSKQNQSSSEVLWIRIRRLLIFLLIRIQYWFTMA